MSSPSIAVLGSGPSGLAAAKALREEGLEPVVFEAAAQSGGMWAAPDRGAWSDFARTNISRYTAAFSDLAWPAGSEVFPLRSDVIFYLRRYADAFDLTRLIRFGTRVEKIRPTGDGRWQLGRRDAGNSAEGLFDQVVIASGFFSEPYAPSFPGLADFAGDVLHSAACTTAAGLRGRCAGKRVLVVGAAFSGTEIAGKLAATATVTVTFRRPAWFVRRWVPATDGGPYYPLDLVITSRRPDNPLRRDPHLFLRRVGGDPGAASPELAFDRDRELPMTIVIGDAFPGLVRDGLVSVKRSATLRFDAGGVTYADGSRAALDAVILCTGCTAPLDFLDRTVLDTIAFDAADQLQSKLLFRDMFHPDLPGLTFIGHYRGPALPVMEPQARWLARILAGALPLPDRATMLAGVAEQATTRAQCPRPQFPHGDVTGLADDLAHEVGVMPALAENDRLWARVMRGPLVPAQYRLAGPHASPEMARRLIAETPVPVLDDQPDAGPAIPARRVLAMLRGRWAIERQIVPGGNFSGLAVFTQRSNDSLLYQETGQLVLDDGTEVAGENSYVYALRNGVIEISFADGPSKGMHFIDISVPGDPIETLPIIAVDRHLCRLDRYDATFRIESPGLFTMDYVVNGPAKGYVSRSSYRRLGSVNSCKARA